MPYINEFYIISRIAAAAADSGKEGSLLPLRDRSSRRFFLNNVRAYHQCVEWR